ncbi:amidophosphoribosyltransferase [Gemmatimonadetes bacterium T265]|nr:amidophosphoribosyltransferase [Gemmatimonadetes bacterium T265]
MTVTSEADIAVRPGTARRIADRLLDLVLPVACVACGGRVATSTRDREIMCGRCWAAVPVLPHPRCERCGHPRRVGAASTAAVCAWCDVLPPYVRACRSVCWVPDGAGGELVRALKYGGWHVAARGIGARVGALDWPDDVIDERIAAIPVPLGRGRLRERGYNQSALIAAPAARRWGVPVWDDVLTRSRATRAQARLTAADRLTNVAGAFRVADGVHARLRGAHVIIVDDVVTTAATLNACAAALVAGGARVVSYATFGRARS